MCGLLLSINNSGVDIQKYRSSILKQKHRGSDIINILWRGASNDISINNYLDNPCACVDHG